MGSKSMQYDVQIKILTIGNSGVGKTCLLLRYSNDSFSPTFITTIGIDFKIKTIDVEGKRVKLQIWDTAGQERFRTITTSYFRGAQGILLVYDVTDRNSFNSIKTWVDEIEKNADKHVNKILVGNKCDVDESARAVKKSEGEALAREYNMPFFETSAKRNIGVEDAFFTIAKQVVDRLSKEGGPGGAKTGGAKAAAGGSDAGKVDVRNSGGAGAAEKGGCCK